MGRQRQRSDGARHPMRWGLVALAGIGGVVAWVQLSRRSAERRVPTMTIGGVEERDTRPRPVADSVASSGAPSVQASAPSTSAPQVEVPPSLTEEAPDLTEEAPDLTEEAPDLTEEALSPSTAEPRTPTAPAGPFGPGSSVPNEDGSAPDGYTIKGNERSRLYHGPDSPHYQRLHAQVWFVDEDAARAAGFQHWNRRRR